MAVADLLPHFEHIDNPRSLGGTYEPNVPWRFVAHTTEVIPTNVSGARSLARRHPTPPHIWCWPEENWRAQTVLLSRSAFALLHPRGTPHTNKMRAIQVEIIGYAKDSPRKPAWWWEWLGVNIVLPIINAGYTFNLDNIAPLTGSDGYGPRGSVRMSRSQWRHFDGLCSHSNVPDNAHWDIGDGRLDLVAAAIHPQQENQMNDREFIKTEFGAWLGRLPNDEEELQNHIAYSHFNGREAAIDNIANSREAKER